MGNNNISKKKNPDLSVFSICIIISGVANFDMV